MAKRVGRPLKKPSDRQLNGITTLVTPQIKTAIIRAADGNGRTLSAEAAARLEHSIKMDALLDRIRQIVREELNARHF